SSSTASSTSTNRSASAAVRGSSEMLEKFRLPPPQPGRRAVSSGRDGQMYSTGPSTRSASSSSTSNKARPAQRMPSITTTRGRRAENAEKNERHAALVSDRTARGESSRNEKAGSSTPTVYARAAVARAGSVV